jgi:hypothetical protein
MQQISWKRKSITSLYNIYIRLINPDSRQAICPAGRRLAERKETLSALPETEFGAAKGQDFNCDFAMTFGAV